MKSFAFTARDASGATTRGHLSADDRAAAVREIRARGLVPLSIEEGAAPAGGARGLPGARVIALAAGALLAAVALVALLARRPAPTPAPPPATGTGTHSAAPSAPAVPAVPATPAAPAAPAVQAAPPAPEAPAAPAAATRGTPQRPVTAAPPHRRPRPSAKGQVLIVNPPPAVTNKPPEKPLFERVTEQRLALYAEPGADMPPPPPGLIDEVDADVEKALASDIEVKAGDDETTVRTKESVALLKEELRKYLAAGGTTRDYFEALAKRQVEEAEMVDVGRSFVIEKLAGGDVNAARKAYQEVNGQLAEKGLPPLVLPAKYRRQLEAAP